MPLTPGDQDLEIFLKGLGVLPTDDPASFIPVNPDNRLSKPTGPETVIASQLGRNPFAMGHYAGEKLRRNAAENRQQVMDAQSSVTATKQAALDRQAKMFETILQNADDLAGSLGAHSVLPLLEGYGFDTQSAGQYGDLQNELTRSEILENQAAAGASSRSNRNNKNGPGYKIELNAKLRGTDQPTVITLEASNAEDLRQQIADTRRDFELIGEDARKLDELERQVNEVEQAPQEPPNNSDEDNAINQILKSDPNLQGGVVISKTHREDGAYVVRVQTPDGIKDVILTR